jgi:hypothetical protein
MDLTDNEELKYTNVSAKMSARGRILSKLYMRSSGEFP